VGEGWVIGIVTPIFKTRFAKKNRTFQEKT